MRESLAQTLAILPHSPGVYQYYDQAGKLLYVGKAKDLAKRVRSYWQQRHHEPWTERMLQAVSAVRTMTVKSDLEATLLESSLIKSGRPFYNIRLRDDKAFPYIRISGEPFPRLTITRQAGRDKARYLGPFLSASYLRILLKLVGELYGLKTGSSDRSYEARSKLPGQIGLGPRNLDNQAKYLSEVEAAIKFLTSPQPAIEAITKKAMTQAAGKERFERAAVMRDRLAALSELRHRQFLFSPHGLDIDYLGVTATAGAVAVYILFQRDGKIVEQEQFLFDLPSHLADGELTGYILKYLYIQGLDLPRKIAVAYLPGDYKAIEEILSQERGGKVSLFIPKRGEVKIRLTTAVENSRYQLRLEAMKQERRQAALSHLSRLLGLGQIPTRIEAFDISNLGPTNIVGASVVFVRGQPAKKEYRQYKIGSPEVRQPKRGERAKGASNNFQQDDFASLRELIFRRLAKTDRPKPDLLLIDGGKGQLSAAIDALKQVKVKVPAVALAKKEEVLYLPNQPQPLILPHDSPSLLLLMAIRDEVHRFALSFHRLRRRKALVRI